MSPANPSHSANGQRPSTAFTVDDAIFTVFRHKWLILVFVCLGIAGALAVRLVKPPLYVSKAKLMVHYVLNSRDVPTTPDSPRAQSLDDSAWRVINAEIEIITSLDVAKRAAEIVGPARILANSGGGTNLTAAAGAICSGIEVARRVGHFLNKRYKAQ